MPTLEEKLQMLGSQEQQEQPSTQEDQGQSWLYRAPAQFNVGLAQVLGLPAVGANMLRQLAGYQEETGLPTGREIQKAMADIGATYEPGEQPETIADRFFQNLGASALPAGKAIKSAQLAGKGSRSLGKFLAAELSSSAGGAAGGKALEATEWGEDNPMMARAVGELAGGLSASSASAAGKIPRAALRMTPMSWARAPFRGEWARRRAVKRLGEASSDPDFAQGRLRETQDQPEFSDLTATQRTGDRGLAQLRKRVEQSEPSEAEIGLRQRSRANQDLLRGAIGSDEGLTEFKGFLDRQLRMYATEADEAMRKARQADHPVTYHKQARQKLDRAYDMARSEESRLWRRLPEGETVQPQALPETYKEEVQNITEGGDIEEIDRFVRQKLGRIGKQGELIGGELLGKDKDAASAKALHQFYSRLGRRIRELSEQSGQTNKIRILNRLRESVLEDLDSSAVGDEYRRAIQFSRDLNNKFTSGQVGKILGFQRGQATPETMTLDDIIGTGGQQARENVQQLLRATPDAEDDIKDFIRTRFAMMTENSQNNRIDRRVGREFLRKNKRLLEAFPDLQDEIKGAIQKQSKIDELVGASEVTEMSPLTKQRATASLFLRGSDPGDEMNRLIQQGLNSGKMTDDLKELSKQASKDPTGKAQRGLKNALVSELLDYSRRSSPEDQLSAENFASGQRLLQRLSDLEEPMRKSGLMSRGDVERLKKIGQAFKGLETELKAGATPEGVVTDAPGTLLDILVRIPMARLGAYAGGSSAAGGIQAAGIMSGLGKKLARQLANDEARNLIIKATRDAKLMDDLLSDVRKMQDKQQMTLVNRIVQEAKDLGSKAGRKAQQVQAPSTAVTPPLVSSARGTQEEMDRQRLEEKLERLAPQ